SESKCSAISLLVIDGTIIWSRFFFENWNQCFLLLDSKCVDTVLTEEPLFFFFLCLLTKLSATWSNILVASSILPSCICLYASASFFPNFFLTMDFMAVGFLS